MRRVKNFFQWQKISGQPINMNDLVLTPQSRSLIVRFPWGTFIWHRPTAVLVERAEQREHLPIIDLTRIIQFGIIGLGVIIIIVRVERSARRKEKAS